MTALVKTIPFVFVTRLGLQKVLKQEILLTHLEIQEARALVVAVLQHLRCKHKLILAKGHRSIMNPFQITIAAMCCPILQGIYWNWEYHFLLQIYCIRLLRWRQAAAGVIVMYVVIYLWFTQICLKRSSVWI